MLETKNLDNIIESIMDEAKTTSQRKITRKEKISRAIGNLAVQQAKKNNDSMYKQYKKYKDLYKKFKAKIVKKYGPKVRSQARK